MTPNRLVTAAICLLLAGPAVAEICPDDQPTAMRGRVVVWEDNLDPPAWRGVGEVFVYAYGPGDHVGQPRTMAVSDGDGHFCVHDTTEGEWVVTAFEPFTYRPFVREIQCAPGACDLGDLALDDALVRISADDVDYQDGWWGGPFGQTLVMPPGAVSLSKISFRSAAASTNDVEVSEWGGSGPVLATATVGFPDTPGGGRATAFFQPGEAAVDDQTTYFVSLGGGSAAYRAGDIYAGGEMYGWDSDIWVPVGGTDLCLTLDVDGVDGNLTSYISGGQDGWVYGDTVGQSFVARSEAITHAAFVVGTPCDLCTIQASIGETFDGPAIGPVKETRGVHEQGVAFAWFSDEVPMIAGHEYFVRYHFPDGWSVAYSWSADAAGDDVYEAGDAWADGNAQGTDLWGRVMGPMEIPGDDDDVADDDTADDDDSSDDDDDASPGPGGGGEGGCECSASAGGNGLVLLLLGLLAAARFRGGCG